jgi:hypothetical protein
LTRIPKQTVQPFHEATLPTQKTYRSHPAIAGQSISDDFCASKFACEEELQKSQRAPQSSKTHAARNARHQLLTQRKKEA